MTIKWFKSIKKITEELNEAATTGNIDTVNYLLSLKTIFKKNKRCNPAMIDDALVFASSNNHKMLASTFIDKGAHVNHINQALKTTALTAAVENNHEILVKFLISKGADVNTIDTTSYAPLSYAASRGNIDIAKHLINEGANINYRSSHYETVIINAVMSRNIEMVKLLINSGADVNPASKSNEFTALMEAALNGSEEIIHILIEAGADINIKSDGETALMMITKGMRQRKYLPPSLYALLGASPYEALMSTCNPDLIEFRKCVYLEFHKLYTTIVMTVLSANSVSSHDDAVSIGLDKAAKKVSKEHCLTHDKMKEILIEGTKYEWPKHE